MGPQLRVKSIIRCSLLQQRQSLSLLLWFWFLLLLDAVVGAEHSSFLYTSVVGRASGLLGALLFVLFFLCFFPSCELLLPFSPVQQWTHPFRTFCMPCVLCGGQKLSRSVLFVCSFVFLKAFWGFDFVRSSSSSSSSLRSSCFLLFLCICEVWRYPQTQTQTQEEQLL